MAVSLLSHDVATAMEAGLTFLVRTQLPSGDFQTFTGPRPDLLDSIPYTKSPYITSFVGHALSVFPENATVATMRQRIADFLEAEEESDGTWNYEGKGEWRLPAELDTTACSAAALLVLGRRQPRSFFPLLLRVLRPNESAPGGPYYTYVGVNEATDIPALAPFAREIDPLVNANVLFIAGLLGVELYGATEYLTRLTLAGDFWDQSNYIISPDFPIYAFSRAYADGRVASLGPAIPALRQFLETRLHSTLHESPAFNVACRTVSLLNVGARRDFVAPYVAAILATQKEDGSWPAWAAWAGFPPNYDGSPALSTAIALEALGKWLML